MLFKNSYTYHLLQKIIHKEPEQGHSQQRNETFFLSNRMIFWPKTEKCKERKKESTNQCL